ncbi:MAG: rhodanese-like domain-containing protein [Blautia sp.]|nr:rhodanese-like domain-containing protein [Blautia sp.]
MFPVETISAKMLDYYVGRTDAMIIDLRDKEEYRKGHVKGAVNIPYSQIDEYTSFPLDKILVLYCDRGSTSLLLARQLAKKGFRTRSVIGGFQAYRGRNLVISP